MHEELGDGVKIGITAVIVVALMSSILFLLSLSLGFSRTYSSDIADAVHSSYDSRLDYLTNSVEPVPVATIYTTLLGIEDSLESFELRISGSVESTSIYGLREHFDEQMYIDVQESAGLYIVRVRSE